MNKDQIIIGLNKMKVLKNGRNF